MPQISLHIDEPTLKKVESAASRDHVSISKWVAEQLRVRLEAVYPAGYAGLFGAVGDESFVRPESPTLDADSAQEVL